jgi:CRISPR system Cascade subunit CasD
MNSVLALFLDAPLQSWGSSSRHPRRTTGWFPTKSGIIGLVAAAMGIDHEAPNQADLLLPLATLEMTAVLLPRVKPPSRRCAAPGASQLSERDLLETTLLEDYHTVQRTRLADGSVDENARTKEAGTKLSWRFYLEDVRFGVLLRGDAKTVALAAEHLKDPRWGVWLGRKACIPAAPLLAGVYGDERTALAALLERAGLPADWPLERLRCQREMREPTASSVSLSDQPIRFGPTPRDREFHPRLVEECAAAVALNQRRSSKP